MANGAQPEQAPQLQCEMLAMPLVTMPLRACPKDQRLEDPLEEVESELEDVQPYQALSIFCYNAVKARMRLPPDQKDGDEELLRPVQAGTGVFQLGDLVGYRVQKRNARRLDSYDRRELLSSHTQKIARDRSHLNCLLIMISTSHILPTLVTAFDQHFK